MRTLVHALALLFLSPGALRAQLVNSEWNTGNGTWNIATSWFPNDVPDNGGGITYDVQIGNRALAAGAGVTFVPEDGTSDTISTLTVTNSGNPLVSGADLFTNGNQLIVIGQTTLDGSGSTIRVDDHNTPGTVAFNTDNLDLNNGGGLTMEGGIASVDVLFEINTGTLGGHGTVNVGDNDAVVEQVFENSGLMQPSSNNSAPQTLTLHANGVDMIDLDGDSETGLVDVSNVLANVNGDTVTLVIDGPLADAFGGTLQIGQRDTVTFNDSFTMLGADVALDGGANIATLNGLADITSITTSAFTIAGAAVIGSDMTFSGVANTITLAANSTLTLNGTVTIPDASAINTSSTGETIVIGGATTITEAAGDFDWDSALMTINGSGFLQLAVDQIDAGNDTYNGALTLADNGDLSVSVTATEWQMAGTLNKNGVGSSNITGDRMVVTSTGNIVVNAGTLDTPAITLQTGSDVTTNGTLILGGGADLAGPTTLTGTGTLRMEASSTVTANSTVNVITFDWDGNAVGGTHTINSGVVFTINSANFDADGDMDDVFSLAGAGSQLVVSGPAQWTANNTITANAAAAGTATIGGTSRMILTSTMNVDGNTTVSAPITFGSGSTTSIDPAMTLSLQGGSNINPNAMAGGTISGTGTLNATTGKVLSGFGTINAPIDFDGTAVLEASGGLLDVNGVINDVGTISIDAAPAVLDLAIAFNTSVTDSGIGMSGGTLQGAAITTATIPKSLHGNGTVSSQVINNGAIQGQSGTLILTNTNSDWDGAANNGQLRADAAGTLELHDNSTFGFTGTVTAAALSTVSTNGFALDFNSGSVLTLTGGTYKSTHTTNIGGTVIATNVGGSTIDVANNVFLIFESTSSTTLSGDLVLKNNNININVGATFSGTGALIVADNSHLVADPNAIIDVLLDNEGTFRPGGIVGIGRVDIRDYQQPDTGKLIVELTGTSLNQFDRLVVNGAAQLGGLLRTEVKGGFVPLLGQTFNVISASAGVSGAFDRVPHPQGMANNQKFKIVYAPTLVQLMVVADTYTPWVTSFPGLGQEGANHDKAADPDFDSLTNLAEFAIDGDPSSGKVPGKLVAKIAPVGGINSFTYSIPVRNGTGLMAGDPLGGRLALEQTTDGVTYAIEASDDLANWTLDVTEVIGADAAAIQVGLPALNAGWVYRTFRSPGPVSGDPSEFIRVVLGGDYVNGSGF